MFSTSIFIPRLKDYVFTDKLGQGSYGEVFKARKRSGARDVVAIKVVRKDNLSKSAVDDIISEISLLKNLKHPNIVEMYDFSWDGNYIYIIMDYCGGGDLSLFIKRKHLIPQSTCRYFLQQLASALRYLRLHSIVHMDLKPHNILLTPLFRGKLPLLKLADFGFAKVLNNSSQKLQSFRGSLLYMAPEILLNEHYDAKVDLWSVGVILYECIFGKAPYKSEDINELMVKIRNDTPIDIPTSPNISPSCYDLLQRLLVRDPIARIDFDDFFCHSYLDLEHMPSDESKAKAIELAEQAVTADQNATTEKEEVLRLYCQALEYFLPLIAIGDGKSEAEVALKLQVERYMNRAESLKRQLSTGLNDIALEDIAVNATTAELEAFRIARLADSMSLITNDPGIVLAKYETALEVLIPQLSKETQGSNRRSILAAWIEHWMSKAEKIKIDLGEKHTPNSVLVQEKGVSSNINANSNRIDCKMQ